MSQAARYRSWLSRFGQSATLNVITGTVCPCMTSRDSTNPTYSAEWHGNNPTAEACNGTGLIVDTTTSTEIKAVIQPFAVYAQSIQSNKEWLSQIGEINIDDHYYCGTVDSSGSFVDISGYNEKNAYITFDSRSYTLRDISTINFGLEEIAQVARLVRRNA
jgi:hypothetical protein